MQSMHPTSFLNNSNYFTASSELMKKYFLLPPGPFLAAPFNTPSIYSSPASLAMNMLTSLQPQISQFIFDPHRFRKHFFAFSICILLLARSPALLEQLRLCAPSYSSSMNKLFHVACFLKLQTSDTDCFKQARSARIFQIVRTTVVLTSSARSALFPSLLAVSHSTIASNTVSFDWNKET